MASKIRTTNPTLAPPGIFPTTSSPPSAAPTITNPNWVNYLIVVGFLFALLFIFHSCTFVGKLPHGKRCGGGNTSFNAFIIMTEAFASAIAIAFIARPASGYELSLGIESQFFTNFVIDSVLGHCLLAVQGIELILDVFFCVSEDKIQDYRYTTLRLLYQANMTQASTTKIERWICLTNGALGIGCACCLVQLVDLLIKKEPLWVTILFAAWHILALGVCTAMLKSFKSFFGIDLQGFFENWRLVRMWTVVKVLCIDTPALFMIASGLEDNPYAATGFILQGVNDIMLAYPYCFYEKCGCCLLCILGSYLCLSVGLYALIFTALDCNDTEEC